MPARDRNILWHHLVAHAGRGLVEDEMFATAAESIAEWRLRRDPIVLPEHADINLVVSRDGLERAVKAIHAECGLGKPLF